LRPLGTLDERAALRHLTERVRAIRPKGQVRAVARRDAVALFVSLSGLARPVYKMFRAKCLSDTIVLANQWVFDVEQSIAEQRVRAKRRSET
jgi:hypothetical protein